MEEQNKLDKENQEKIIDFKETFKDLIEEPKPELSQEDAIRQYKDEASIASSLKKKKVSSDNSEENEDEEHLKRVKKELLDSLARVKELEKNIFKENDKENIKGIKVKKSSNGGGKGKSDQEQILDQMRQKVQEETERSREE